MRIAFGLVLETTAFLAVVVWLISEPPRRDEHRKAAEERRQERESRGLLVPRARWWHRFSRPGWYTDPATPAERMRASWAHGAPPQWEESKRHNFQRLWDGRGYGWTQYTRVLPGWYPDPWSDWMRWWSGNDWNPDESRPPTVDECRHPRSYRITRYDRRFSCDLCGLLGPCPHVHKRVWSASTEIGSSWECYDCGARHHGQLIPPPGSPGNP